MNRQTGYRSHLIPRTRDGWIAVIAFVGLFLLAMPPATHRLWNRTEPWIFGVPFLYGILLIIYIALICVLIWTYRRKI